MATTTGVSSGTGLVSGINYSSIISGIVAADQRPITLLQQQESNLQSTETEFSKLSLNLSNLNGAVSALSQVGTFNSNTVSVSNSTSGASLLSASADSTAVPGLYQVKVSQLAQASSIASQGFVDQTTTAVSSSGGTFTFRIGAAGQATSVAVTSTMTLAQLRDAINAANGGATASIISTGSASAPYRLVLTAKKQGAANSVTVTSNPTTLDFVNKKIGAAYGATTNSFTGTVSSNAGNNYTGSTNKSVLVQIVSGGAAGTATYKYSTDGGITYLGANGAAFNGSNGIATQSTLTNYLDGSASANSTNEGAQIAFGTGTLAAGDTFSIDEFNPTLQSAQDAVITTGNQTLTQSSNTFTGAIQGVTLNLLQADSSQTVNVTVGTNTSNITGKVNDFVTAYNQVMSYLNGQLSYDPKGGPAQPLLGEGIAIQLKQKLQSLITDRVPGSSAALTGLATVGVTSDPMNGQLTFDSSKFAAALSANGLTNVTRLFVGLGAPDNPAVQYLSKTADTQQGSYGIVVSTAPQKATVIGGSVVPAGGIAAGETVTVSLYSHATQAGNTPLATSVTLAAGSKISDIVNALNSAFTTNGLALSASNNAGKVQLTSTNYGADTKIVAMSTAANNGSQSGIGTTPLTSSGVDIAGTINGHVATGSGAVLTGAAGFPESGLQVSAPVAASGLYGTVTISSGIMDQMTNVLAAATQSNGSIQTRISGINDQITRLQGQVAQKQTQLNTEQATLTAQFNQLEVTLGRLKAQSDSLTQGVNQLYALATAIATHPA
ncbi:MAG: flagellar filament capping protein FliD [Nitrospirota bacterium]|nr:flagellar filament capping protein FliD [Nitrospirota bacterium]